jgi:NAD-dependent dihydropyrimidine dehydrogenase PreA subunit
MTTHKIGREELELVRLSKDVLIVGGGPAGLFACGDAADHNRCIHKAAAGGYRAGKSAARYASGPAVAGYPADAIYLHSEGDRDIPYLKYPEECWHCGSCRQDCPEGTITIRFSPDMLSIKPISALNQRSFCRGWLSLSVPSCVQALVILHRKPRKQGVPISAP